MAESGRPAADQDRRRKYWRLGSFIVVRYVDLQPSETAYDGFIDGYLDDWLRNPLTMSVIEECLRYTSYGLSNYGTFRSPGSVDVRTRLLESFRRKELVLLLDRVNHPIGRGTERQSSTPDSAPPPRPQREKTWIEVQLVNKKGQPVAGARYRLKITDGSVREGKLNENGSVRVSGIDPGMCEITFLDYDAKEWMPA
jgi:hypothetical protein